MARNGWRPHHQRSLDRAHNNMAFSAMPAARRILQVRTDAVRRSLYNINNRILLEQNPSTAQQLELERSRLLSRLASLQAGN